MAGCAAICTRYLHPTGVSVRGLATPLPIQLPGKAAEAARWVAPCQPHGHSGWNSRLLTVAGPTQAVEAMWGVNLQMEELSLSLTVTL